jgi:hypothetical protein
MNTRQLAVNETHTLSITSEKDWVETGIRLAVGERYRLTASGTWKDRNTPSGPAGNPNPSVIQKLFAFRLRHKGARYFALIGCIDRDLSHSFVIGDRVEFAVSHSGELFCFANDVPGFYGNNKGAVSVTVERLG